MNSATAAVCHTPRALHSLARALAIALAAGLAGCGGGVVVGIGGGAGGWDDMPPQATIAGPLNAKAGGTAPVAVAAVDDYGVARVTLLVIDTSGKPVEVGTLSSPPYRFTVVVPNDGRDSIDLFAKVEDTAGQISDSNVVRLMIAP